MNKKIVMITLVIGLFIVGTGYTGIGSAVTDQDIYKYSPILYFVNGEKCYPVNVSYAFENCYLYEVGNPTPISTSPTAELLASYSTSDNFYLDNQRGTVAIGDDGIENDYQSKMNELGYKIYAHVDSLNNVIQYWFFYAFNGGDLNRHEGDWEMIQVVFSGEQPVEVMYSQHNAGQTATWKQVEKDGDHVKVYVAKGSHANYIKPYSGKVGLASDTVADNGKILRSVTDYTIDTLDTESWLNFAGRWGWYGADESQSAEAAILGEAGPNGPMFREDGTMWQPLVWAGGLQPANDYVFILEWFVYNFLLLFIIFTLISLLLLAFFIYRRHKKHGLGPRLFSLFYIDGMNAKSIGNILCIIGIIVTILGLIYPWYTVTANVSIPQYTETGSFNALSVDGLNGIQVRLPDRSGPMPLGAFALPFYVLIGIGLVFLVLATIGISTSKKLGKKYLTRSIRLVVYFILILGLVMAIGSIVKMAAPPKIQGNADMFNTVNAISAAPFGGQYSAPITDVSGGSVFLQWGFGIGAYLLLIAGIILLIAGLLEITAHAQFYEEKSPAPTVSAKNIEEKKE
ncbi:Vacuolar protein sorting-associated protein 62 [uncultured archaeon]|nr:Vacuolar protein sorting-associated protein 62 [uncultured archaeon]